MSSKVAGRARASMKRRSHPSRENDPLRGAELAFLEGPSGVTEHRRGHFDHFLFLRNPCTRVVENGLAPLVAPFPPLLQGHAISWIGWTHPLGGGWALLVIAR